MSAVPIRSDRKRARADNLIVAMGVFAALMITALKLAGWLV